MFSLTAPTEDEVRRFITQQKDSGLLIPGRRSVGYCRPSGLQRDHNRIQLGKGKVCGRGIGCDSNVANVQHAVGEPPLADRPNSPWRRGSAFRTSLWVLFAECLSNRISRGSRRQCGAIWLCLWDLSERNTQRAEKNDSPSNGTEQTTPFGYDIHAISRPRQMLARLGYPPSRLLREKICRLQGRL